MSRPFDLAYAAATARTAQMPEFRPAEAPAARALAPANAGACRRDCETCAPSRNGLHRVCVADSLDGLDALKEAWETLEREAAAPLTPFQSFAFCRAMAETMLKAHPDYRLHVICVRRAADDAPLLILPMEIETHAGVRVARWLAGPAVQYGDVIAAGLPDDDALKAAIDSAGIGGRADVFDFRNIRQDAAIAPFLARTGHATGVTSEAPFVDLTRGTELDAVLAPQPAKRKKDRRRKWRRIAERGDTRFEVVGPGPRAAALMRQALAFKLDWLEANGLVSRALSRKWVRDGLVAVAATAPATRLSVLSVDDDVAAIEVGFVEGRRYHAFMGAINAAHGEVSPGELQTEETLSWCLDGGMERYDFLPPVQRYKLGWAAQTETVANYALSRSWRGWLYARLYLGFAEPRMKEAFHRLPAPARQLLARLFGQAATESAAR
ncbi:CelD/BcsL family acetyltransferase involved in cellulose biosynthesis [Rhodobium orientis]|uniref:GNAT family N-acetyltransferase n=1 Tax=Rhodobium orientis TaxID=34017 RepID=UPI0011B93B51|nr:GNAT family N-acetyltransferase [Rhodobium orientis]MBB4301855.1 CelD/BcsL family acetyltransferase involved in cellulose biosynthesis [Rhodobium orientis]